MKCAIDTLGASCIGSILILLTNDGTSSPSMSTGMPSPPACYAFDFPRPSSDSMLMDAAITQADDDASSVIRLSSSCGPDGTLVLILLQVGPVASQAAITSQGDSIVAMCVDAI